MVSFLREEELRYPALLKNIEKMFPMAMSKQVSKLLLGYWVSTRPSVLAEFSVKLGKESTLVTSDIVLELFPYTIHLFLFLTQVRYGQISPLPA